MLTGFIGAALVVRLLMLEGPHGRFMPGCLFHRVTGLACPGCGLTRATYALFQGRVSDAFRLNPLGLVVLPVALLGLALQYLDWILQPGPGWRLNLSPRGSWILVGTVIAYWVARNTPWWPWPLPG